MHVDTNVWCTMCTPFKVLRLAVQMLWSSQQLCKHAPWPTISIASRAITRLALAATGFETHILRSDACLTVLLSRLAGKETRRGPPKTDRCASVHTVI